MICVCFFVICIVDSLGVDMISLNLQQTENTLVITAPQQNSSSSFIASKVPPQGFGYLPTFIRYDPTYHRETSLHSLLIPSELEIENASPIHIEGERECFAVWGETEAGGITEQFKSISEKYGLVANGQHSLSTRNGKKKQNGKFNGHALGLGIAHKRSFEDFHTHANNLYSQVMEVKGAEGSILAAILEGTITGTNFAMDLYAQGLEASKVVVPVIACTGLCMVIGAVILLEKSFPTYIPLSKRLDISDPVESKIASAFLLKSKLHCRSIEKPASCSRDKKRIKMAFASDKYFYKVITARNYNRGLGLFDPGNNFNNIQLGITHMMRVLNQLYANTATRDIPEYPISIRTPSSDDGGDDSKYWFIYRNLSLLGYKTGCPNRFEEPEIFKLFLSELNAVVNNMYRIAGVVHGDLYASNIMYKYENNEVSIKIVDWDASHCVSESNFSDLAQSSLDEYFKNTKVVVKLDEEHDRRYVKVFNLDVTDENAEFWRDLASGKKEDMDDAFYHLFMKSLGVET